MNFLLGHAGQKIALQGRKGRVWAGSGEKKKEREERKKITLQGPSFLDTASGLISDILVLLEHLASACSFMSSSGKGGPPLASVATSDLGSLDP